MTVDVVDLRAFYSQPLGVMARRLVNEALRQHWGNVRGMTVLGLGYATPYLGLFRGEAARSLAFMPARQGVIHWPTGRAGKSALVMEDLLPLADASIDRMLIVHALENAIDVQGLMREAWRVLAAGGRIIVIAPSRGSLWALRDNNPFAQGRPYSRRQLNELMRQTAFTPVAWSEALWMPPWGRLVSIRTGPAIDRAGRMLSLPMAGLHLVEATKQVYRPISAPASRYALPSWGGILVPQPSARKMEP